MSIILQDTFHRANVPSGWGTATDGNAWTTQTLQSGTVQVSANEGQASNVNGLSADLTLGTTTKADGDVVFRWQPSNVGDDAFAMERNQSAGNFYYLGQDLNGVEAIKKRVSSTGTTLTSKTHTLTASSWYWVHSHVQGSTLSVRTWLDGTTEPTLWDLTVTDTSFTTAGKFGAHLSTLTASNTLQLDTFSVDDLTGHNISGSIRSKYLLSMAIKGTVRAKFAEAIASFGRLRAKFTESIASRGIGRARFTESIGSTGRIRSKFVESQALRGLIRSRFYGAAVSKGQARAKFAEAITQKSGARSKFLLSIGQKAASRSKFVLSKAISGLSRSSYLISKASRGLARSKFAEAIVQKGQARSKFLLSAAIRGLAESTFKIAVSGGHAISAYMRSRYKISIRQSQAQRSRFQIRFPFASQARSTFRTAFKSTAQTRSRFLTAFRLVGKARSRFVLRIAQAAAARSRFLVSQIVNILPIKSITHNVAQSLKLTEQVKTLLALVESIRSVLQTAWKTLGSLSLSSIHIQSLTVTHQGIAMPAPNSTILSTITVTDVSGAVVSNASAVSVIVYFPDGTTATYSLGSGITNIGNGQYQAKYNTKSPGIVREVWSIVAADGVTLASEQFEVGVGY